MELLRKNRSQETHEHNVLVLGVGGAGVNILCNMGASWGDHLKGYAVDTDHQSVTACRERNIPVVHLETRSTQGMSTAGDVDSGRHAVYENREEFAGICSKADFVFIVAGFGGGTGTGAAVALAEIAADTGALILGFIMMPFEFEGVEREIKAKDGLAAFQDIVDGVVLYQNERLLAMADDKTSMTSAFQIVTDCVTRNIDSIYHLICDRGLINLDFADIRRMVMDSHGVCTLVAEEASGEDRCSEVVRRVIDHPLFDCRRVLADSRAVIVGIRGGEHLTLCQVQHIMQNLKDVIGENTRLVIGTAIDPEWTDRIGLILMASERFEIESLESSSAEASAPAKTEERLEGGKRRKKSKAVQSRLNLDLPGKGRFKDVEPTLRNGEDLDVPAFIRRGIQLSGDIE